MLYYNNININVPELAWTNNERNNFCYVPVMKWQISVNHNFVR